MCVCGRVGREQWCANVISVEKYVQNVGAVSAVCAEKPWTCVGAKFRLWVGNSCSEYYFSVTAFQWCSRVNIGHGVNSI